MFSLEYSKGKKNQNLEAVYYKATCECSPNPFIGISLRLRVAKGGLPAGSAVSGGEHSPPLTGDGPKEPFWLRGPKDNNAVLLL